MDVLAGCERLQADLDVRRRDRQVDDDLDRRDRRAAPRPTSRRSAELGRARLGRLGPDVGDALDVEDRKVCAALR